MQPLCEISKKLYGKSKPCNNLSTALRRIKPNRYLPCWSQQKSRGFYLDKIHEAIRHKRVLLGEDT